MEDYIRMEHITKRFPGVTACNDVTLGFRKGEIHALLGENGAGKSTMMNMLYGLLKADEGQILIDGKDVQIHSPNDAISNGIGMVHQHFMLIQKFTALENVILGTKMEHEPLLSTGQAKKKILQISEETGLGVNPDAKVSDLSVGDQQRVEIVKALFKGVRTLIMDEPTAVLTPQETDELFTVLRRWVKNGNTVIFITHKMREVSAFCDRVSVLRDGRYIGTVETQNLSEDEIAEMMVGRKVSLQIDKKNEKIGETVLCVRDLSVKGAGTIDAVKNVSFDVHEGEILGIAGVDGNGQEEMINAIIGLAKAKSGEVMLDGTSILGKSPKKILEAGLSNIPFNRQTEGLAMNFSISDNFILKEAWNAPYDKHGMLQKKIIREKVCEAIEKYSIKANGPDTKAANMSGGNQQKVIIAREMEREHKILLACHPTHGLDIGAIEFIHHCLVQERDNGKGVLLVSTELDELLSLSDRIIVMFKGEIMGEVAAGAFDVSEIGLMMAGKQQKAS